MKRSFLLILVTVFAFSFSACDGQEQRRGTPHHEGSLPQEQTTNGREVRPAIDGSEATGQGPMDTVSRGREGATSY